jgi:uncharacterized protein (TIGR00369 family)
MPEIPEGFAPHFRKSPVTDPWEPLYSRKGEASVEIGFRATAAHCNSRGFVHGGVIAALADNALGLSVGAAMAGQGAPPPSGLVTVSLTLDYLATARIGQWVSVAPRVLKAGRNLGFADAIISADDAPVARASASFRVMA